MDDRRDWLQELRDIVTDAQALLQVAGADADEAVHQMQDKLTESLDRARAALEGLEEDATRYVRDNPWQALGLAAAVGALLGVLLSRRR
jgi:ElaB/YqjD/DUF883 family membrane-anchored ribosome-binding protein